MVILNTTATEYRLTTLLDPSTIGKSPKGMLAGIYNLGHGPDQAQVGNVRIR